MIHMNKYTIHEQILVFKFIQASILKNYFPGHLKVIEHIMWWVWVVGGVEREFILICWPNNIIFMKFYLYHPHNNCQQQFIMKAMKWYYIYLFFLHPLKVWRKICQPQCADHLKHNIYLKLITPPHPSTSNK